VENELKLILAGVVVNEELGFRFEVWADEKLPDRDLKSAYRGFLVENDSHAQRKSLRGVIVRQYKPSSQPA